jgi:restriction system protein
MVVPPLKSLLGSVANDDKAIFLSIFKPRRYETCIMCEMARRQQSKEAAILESVTGLAGLVVFLLVFSPNLRPWTQLLMACLVLILLGWVVYNLIREKSPSPTFRAFSFNPHPIEEPISKQRPTTFVEESQKGRPMSERILFEKLRKIDWFQFERLVEIIYQHRGFEVERLGGANPDGGVDLILKSATEHFAVQCKHWRKSAVGVKEIREFLGALTDNKIPKGIYVTLVGYSNEAKQLADKHGIQILKESDLIKMLEQSALTFSNEISKLLSDERKFCPKCESELIVKTNRMNGAKFWGCSTFPYCMFTLNNEV